MSMTAEEIVRSGLPAAITVDGSVITKSTADAIKARGEAGVPLIAGTNAREVPFIHWVKTKHRTTILG